MVGSHPEGCVGAIPLSPRKINVGTVTPRAVLRDVYSYPAGLTHGLFR